MIIYFIPLLSTTSVKTFLISPLWACFSGRLVLGAAAGAAAGADLATSAAAQPSPPHTAGGAWAGCGSSPVQTGISSLAREEMGGGGAGDWGGD